MTRSWRREGLFLYQLVRVRCKKLSKSFSYLIQILSTSRRKSTLTETPRIGCTNIGSWQLMTKGIYISVEIRLNNLRRRRMRNGVQRKMRISANTKWLPLTRILKFGLFENKQGNGLVSICSILQSNKPCQEASKTSSGIIEIRQLYKGIRTLKIVTKHRTTHLTKQILES